MDRPIDSFSEDDANTPDEEFFAELFDETDAPVEPAAEERARRTSVDIEASEVYDRPMQEALVLLSIAISKLGGVLVITPEELTQPYALAIDNRYRQETGGMRLSAWPKQES
jgi:hypothetical protein